MKKYLLCLGLSVLAIVGLTSCDEASRLAKNICGAWTGTPVGIAGNTLQSTAIETFTFTLDEAAKDARSGNLTITSVITSQSTFGGDAVAGLPAVNLSIASTGSITGTWTAIDDDEISVSLDPRSLLVNVDPDAVELSSGMFTADMGSQIDSLRPQLTNAVRMELMNDLATRYSSFNHFDDVKVKKGALLKFEIGPTDYVLTRTGSVSE
ncbi:MAG: hypothetical protein NC098_09210 [Lachnoclostridium sp.]|nr:hypothetical protein [Lachnoclostridium sp.]